MLPKHTKINTYAINLEVDKQPPYGPIYSPRPVELETLKTYIKIYLVNDFIHLLKSLADTPNLFDKKLDRSFQLCIDYQRLNNIIIKKWYPLLFVGKSLDCLGRAQQFTQLDPISAYHWIRIKENNQWKIAFQTKYNHFEYQIMFFNLTNILGSFEDYVNKILAKKLDIFVIVYLDDILIYTKNSGKSYVKAVW